MKKVVRLGFSVAAVCLAIVLGLGLISSAFAILFGLPFMTYWILTEPVASGDAIGLGVLMTLISIVAWVVLICYAGKELHRWAFSE